MRTVRFPDGVEVPALGQGTWKMGERAAAARAEADALRLGLDLGMTLIDTAEMYGEGAAEEVVREAIRDRRDQVFLVSKVYPHNATRAGTPAACERSLKRLGTDRLDLYLLHWRGSVPLSETIEAMERLVQAGKIRRWGVSNFDLGDMGACWDRGCASNQVIYNLGRRGIEFDLLPELQRRGVPMMAYSPVEQGRLVRDRTLAEIAKARGATPAQVALAWVLRQALTIAIPKAAVPAHVQENRGAAEIALTPAELARLDQAFPAPRRKRPLEML